MASLGLLVLQNASIVLLIRQSRLQTTDEPNSRLYSSSVAVAATEFIKLLFSFFAVVWERHTAGKERRSWSRSLGEARTACFGDGAEMLKMAVPGALYALLNNLGFFALSNLPSAIYHVSYQSRILTTAIIGSFAFNKRLSSLKWLSLALLTTGVAIVQLNNETDTKSSARRRPLSSSPSQNTTLGYAAVALASLISGIAGCYFEFLLRGTDGSPKVKATLWERNVQLAFPCFLFALAGVYVDPSIFVDEKTGARMFFAGFGWLQWTIVADAAVGGLLVALVVRQAGAVAKGFATSLSIVVSTVISALVSGRPPGQQFSIGAALVVVATTLYSAG